jgi:hypothetical protein
MKRPTTDYRENSWNQPHDHDPDSNRGRFALGRAPSQNITHPSNT